MSTKIDEAQAHLLVAFTLLKAAGLSEKFFPLAVDVGQKEWGRFFGEFGDDTGLLLEIKTNVPCEVSICLTVRRQHTSLWKQIKEGIREGWSVFRRRDTSYKIHLADHQVTKLKDLLRNI